MGVRESTRSQITSVSSRNVKGVAVERVVVTEMGSDDAVVCFGLLCVARWGQQSMVCTSNVVADASSSDEILFQRNRVCLGRRHVHGC
jgi:hypothetical protein